MGLDCNLCKISAQTLRFTFRGKPNSLQIVPNEPNPCGANYRNTIYAHGDNPINPVSYLGETVRLETSGVGIKLFDKVLPDLGPIGRYKHGNDIFIGNSADVYIPPGTIGVTKVNFLRFHGSQDIGQIGGNECPSCNFCIRISYTYVDSCIVCKKQAANVSSTRLMGIIDDKSIYHELVDTYTYAQCVENSSANTATANSIKKTILNIAASSNCIASPSFSVQVKNNGVQPNCVTVEIIDSPVKLLCIQGGGGEYYYFDNNNC